MIIVIQCAAKKKPDAGHFRDRDGREVLFVAQPEQAPPRDDLIYAQPDDVANAGGTWRTSLLKYNDDPGGNPFGLLPAWRLYANKTYDLLATKYGAGQLYILSAGWGLIAADFLTPVYDITFSAQAESYKRRRRKDAYADLCMLP